MSQYLAVFNHSALSNVLVMHFLVNYCSDNYSLMIHCISEQISNLWDRTYKKRNVTGIKKKEKKNWIQNWWINRNKAQWIEASFSRARGWVSERASEGKSTAEHAKEANKWVRGEREPAKGWASSYALISYSFYQMCMGRKPAAQYMIGRHTLSGHMHGIATQTYQQKY